MQYQLGPYRILVNENRVTFEGSDASIRPKTLELLLYFIEHQHKIISKQELLDAVWQSAGAQEHVLFQSINEIRKTFQTIPVIKTHPRKGYQWIASACAVPSNTDKISPRSEETESSSNLIERSHNNTVTKIVAASCAAILLVGGWIAIAFMNGKNSFEPKPSRELIVLPIENTIPDSTHAWVRLGGMDMIIQTLESENRFYVPDSEDVLMALARSESFAEQDIEQLSQNIRTQMGEVVTLHSKLIGLPMEYQLHYSLIGRYQVKQGIVFSGSIPDLFQKLRNEVLNHYEDPLSEERLPIAEQTANYNFLQAMESYYRHDYRDAAHAFSALVNIQKNNATAQRFLLKSLVALKEFDQAKIAGDRALALAIEQEDTRNQLRSLFELGVLASQEGKFEQAKALIAQSQNLAEEFGDTLYIAYSHTELGNIMSQMQLWDQAEGLYQTALQYHQGFQCAYGQVHNLSLLAMVDQNQKQSVQAQEHLDSALKIAKTNALSFLEADLLMTKANYSDDIAERELWTRQANTLLEKH